MLAAEEAERHRRVILVVDEAQLLTPEQLEELRLLTNADFDSRTPFVGILADQPTLSRRLRIGAFAALDQRVAVRFALTPMDLSESLSYLRHHLALVGRSDPLFVDDAVARLHRAANGLPRQLNNAAIAALIAAAAEERRWSTTPAPSAQRQSSRATEAPPVGSLSCSQPRVTHRALSMPRSTVNRRLGATAARHTPCWLCG